MERITGISSMATRHVLAELAEAYTQQSGQPVAIESVGGVDALRRVQEGEAFDFVVLAADAIEKLAAGGRVDPASRIDLARSGVAIAVAAGAPRPDIASESAFATPSCVRARSAIRPVRAARTWSACSNGGVSQTRSRRASCKLRPASRWVPSWHVAMSSWASSN